MARDTNAIPDQSPKRRRGFPLCRRGKRAMLVLPCLAMSLAAGCSRAIVGHWRMVKAVPNADVFAIEDAHFTRDGNFAATVTIEGKTARENGTYAFNGFKLTMRPHAGGQRRYNAARRLRTLEVMDGDRKVILRKTKKPDNRQGNAEDQDE